MNVYEYVGSDPLGCTDPVGLWEITRKGGKTASAVASKGDTIEKLAIEIQLDSEAFKKWLSLVGGKLKTVPHGERTLSELTAKDAICPGQSVNVPNTVLAFWAGELGEFGKWWVRWESDVAALKAAKYHVASHQGWTAKGLETYIQLTTKAKELQGIFFWGHGSKWGVGTDSNNKDVKHSSLYRDWKPAYQMGLGILFACYTQSGRGQFSKNAIFWGKKGDGEEGKLWPHGFHLFGPTVSEIIAPEKKEKE